MEIKSGEKTFIKRIIAGAAIGLGCVMPGISGGVMAVSFGLYRPMLDALAGLRRGFRKNFLFLLPLGIGAAAGLLLGALVLDKLMESYSQPLLCLFIGLILGGLPAFMREANGESGFRLPYLAAAALGAAAACCLLLLEGNAVDIGSAQGLIWWQYMICGGIIAVGTLVPGISTSFILIYLGWYAPLLNVLSSMDIAAFLLTAAGAAIIGLLLLKGIRWCFDRFGSWAYYTVLGFLLVSVVLVFPMLSGALWWSYLFLPVGLALGIVFAGKK